MYIKNTYGNESGKQIIRYAVPIFREFISRLESIYNVRPFNQQSAGSLLELYLLTLAITPKTIVEIGTGTRSSTLALALAAGQLTTPSTIYGIDISPGDFGKLTRTYFPDFRFGRVNDLSLNLADFDIPADWDRPLLMLYDAHDNDIPGVVISSHAIAHWFPKLQGQVVMVHDCSVYPADQVLHLDGEHVSARHFSGRQVAGFFEVEPIVQWMNANSVPLNCPGDELVDLGFERLDSSLIYFSVPQGPSAQTITDLKHPASLLTLEDERERLERTKRYTLTPQEMGNEVTIAVRGPCNYTCSYCVAKNYKESTSSYDLARLEEVYAACSGLTITTLECGGSEPTIHPQIQDILEIALRYGPASIPTNNSLDPQRWLPRTNPQNMLVRAALHPQGEQKLDDFLERLLKVRASGADIRVVWVAHPERFDDLKRLKDYFGKHAIIMDVTAYQGEWNGRPYPLSYTPDERNLLGIGEDSYWYQRLAAETAVRDFSRIPCLAGCRSIYIAADGSLYRCLYDKTPLQSPLNKAAPCRVANCGCGLLLEELSTLGDPVFWDYWRKVAGRPPLNREDPRSAEERYQDYRAVYWELMRRFGKAEGPPSAPDPSSKIEIYAAGAGKLWSDLKPFLHTPAEPGRVFLRSGSLLRFNPPSPADHLYTEFIPLQRDGAWRAGWLTVELDCANSINQIGSVVVLLQDQTYTTLGQIHTQRGQVQLSETFRYDPQRTQAVRFVLSCEAGGGCFLPGKITLSQLAERHEM